MSVTVTASATEHDRPAPAEFDPAPSRRLRAEQLEALAGLVHRVDERPWQRVENPSTGRAMGRVPVCEPQDVIDAVARARRAQDGWAHRSFAERAKPLLRFASEILDRQEEILDLIQLENGKARRNAFEEVADCALVANYYAREAARILAPRRRKGLFPGLTVAREYHHPLGVVGFVAPWNYPLTLAVTDAFAALMAGNTVVLKPDLQTALTALWALDLLRECGLPQDAFQIVTGEGPVLGPPLIGAVDYVCFTGSTAVGRLVARQAGERLIGCSAELGGKNPMLVLADADLDAAIEGAVRACFSNAGQLCISIERLFVHEEVYPRFRDRFVAATRAMRLGSGLDYDTDMGTLISAKQLAAVELHVADAVAKGARVLTGGRPRPDLGPYFFEPTILEGVTPEMSLYEDETFGPVVSLYRFESINEAIERANATRYGLNASVWTRDADLAWRIATRIEAGTVNINEAYAAAWGSVDAPMGGFKDSGLGRRHGEEGILKYTEAQTVALQRGVPVAPLKGMSNERYSDLMTKSIRILNKIGM
jgi:succinate-semialdehyde dehydrogenase/glutarate-semialdehyde dehydrogenase